MKRNPFEISHQGESIDPKFFTRMIRFENYYHNLLQDNNQFEPNFEAVKKINSYIQKDQLDIDDIQDAISVYNSTNSKPHHDGSGWFDLRLHLRHLAFVYGYEYVSDNNFNLIQKHK